MKARMKRIEIYLSPDSPSDAHLIAIWERLSQEGRGRAQAAFRQALCSLFDQYPMPDQREPVRRPARRGPAPTWHPTEVEIERAALSPALFNEETIPAPRQAPVPRERPVSQERTEVGDSAPPARRAGAPGASGEDASFPSYPIPSPAIPPESKPQAARSEPRPAEAPPPRPGSTLPLARPSGPPLPPRAGGIASEESPTATRREIEPVGEPASSRPSDSPARGGSRYRNLMKRNE